MAGGAVVGGAAGYAGAAVASSGIPYANTAGMATASLTNSIGMNILTGGDVPVSLNLGIASYNFKNGSFGYLGKKGNSFMENLSYGMGLYGNLSDLGTKRTMLLNTEKNDLINHSAILEENGNIVISQGPAYNWIEPKGTVDHYLNRF